MFATVYILNSLGPGKKRVNELNVLMLKLPVLVHDKSVVTLIYVSYKVSVSSNTGVIKIFSQPFIPRSRDDQCAHFDHLANQHYI